MAANDVHPGTLYTPSNEHPPVIPQWASRTQHRRTFSSSSVNQPHKKGVIGAVNKFRRHVHKHVKKMTVAQQVVVASLLAIALVGGLLFMIYHEAIFVALLPLANKWRALPGGWLIIFFLCFASAFPPLIGYSTSVTLAGFVYGFPNGWFIVAASTIVGSTSSFIACRLFFRDFARRILKSDARFAALALTLKHDGLKLLCMIRLTPLPYNLSNAALSALSVSPWAFAFATAIATPKLLIHVYIGSALYTLADTGSKMSGAAKALNYVTIVVGIILGVTTGFIIYRRTMKRAAQLEEQERARVREGLDGTDDGDLSDQLFSDDPIEADATRALMMDEEGGHRGSTDNPIARGRDLVKDSFNALGGMFTVSDSEAEDPEDGRLLDDMDGDLDAEELMVVDQDTVVLDDQRASGGRNSNVQNGRIL